MNNLSQKVNHIFEMIYLVIFVCMFTSSATNGQVDADDYIYSVDIDVDSIEDCFGYKLVSCHHFYIYRSGVYQKNKAVVAFEYDEKGQITNFELGYNDNYSLDFKDFANCVLPYIKLSPSNVKFRYGRVGKDKIMLIFDDEINYENEKQYCMTSLRKTKKRTIDSFKERRRLKSHDWDLNKTKFNTLVNDKDAQSIFNKLEEQSNEMLNEHLIYCERYGTQLDKSQHNYQPLGKRIGDYFQKLLYDYFEK